MAKNSDTSCRNQIIYSIFVRNYSKEGTFAAVETDLPRIKDLGADIIWLMPIHPTGKKARKGSLGSPYAISDYRAINPEFGTMDDFISLTNAIHAAGMKVIIDVVYNHTSPDSVLLGEHPEWFYTDENGNFGNHLGAWSDVIDLDYSRKDLWDYQIETLKMWAKYVDGFRCDVAPFVPVSFWNAARQAVAQVHPDAIWLAESGELGFIQISRLLGVYSHSDAELYEAFDLCYDYDGYTFLLNALTGAGSFEEYVSWLNAQECIYPGNYGKMRFLENHDKERGSALLRDESPLKSLTAFIAFEKGPFLIYAGQERGDDHRPSLFDKDTILQTPRLDLTPFFKKLSSIKRIIDKEASYHAQMLDKTTLFAMYQKDGACLCGIFPLECKKKKAVLLPQAKDGSFDDIWTVPDGTFADIYGGKEITVENGAADIGFKPVIFEFSKSKEKLNPEEF